MSKFAELSAALSARRAIHPYPFPGLEGHTVGIRTLSESELDMVRLEAARFCKGKAVEAVLDPEFFDRVVQRLTLLHACFDLEEKHGKFFATHEEVTQLGPHLFRSLYELYCAHVQSMDPLAYCTPEEVEVLVEQLGKSEIAAARLSLFDRPTLQSFALSLVNRLRAMSPTPNASTGSSSTPST